MATDKKRGKCKHNGRRMRVKPIGTRKGGKNDILCLKCGERWPEESEPAAGAAKTVS